MQEKQGPLTGVRVGADVIKTEAPQGDSTRQIGPATEADMASLFLAVNRNRRSVVLDLSIRRGGWRCSSWWGTRMSFP
jgi:crotonobetainyl-CoA:carnitine CoA-transferase CaiB-like acyl-CoA transferase